MTLTDQLQNNVDYFCNYNIFVVYKSVLNAMRFK